MSKILFLDAGHGAGDPGAVGNGTTEEIMAIKIVDALYKWAKKYGIKVEKYPHNKNSYEENHYKDEKDKNKQVIEVHLNGNDNPNSNGTEVLLDDDFSIDEADAIDKGILRASSKYFKNRGLKLAQLRNSDQCRLNGVGYRLLEVCFISNSNDMNTLNNNIDNYAKDIIKSIYKEFGGTAPVENNNIYYTQVTETLNRAKYKYITKNLKNGVIYKKTANGNYTIATWNDKKIRVKDYANENGLLPATRFIEKIVVNGETRYMHGFLDNHGTELYLIYKIVK